MLNAHLTLGHVSLYGKGWLGVLFDLSEEVQYGKREIPAQSLRAAIAKENLVK